MSEGLLNSIEFILREHTEVLFPFLFPPLNCYGVPNNSNSFSSPTAQLDQHQEFPSLYLRGDCYNVSLGAPSLLATNCSLWGEKRGPAPSDTINYPDHCPKHPAPSCSLGGLTLSWSVSEASWGKNLTCMRELLWVFWAVFTLLFSAPADKEPIERWRLQYTKEEIIDKPSSLRVWKE